MVNGTAEEVNAQFYVAEGHDAVVLAKSLP
jgi:hypothetical protein